MVRPHLHACGAIADCLLADAATQMKAHLPPPGSDTQARCLLHSLSAHLSDGRCLSLQILVCGPPPMIKFACRPAFEQLGFKDSMLMIW